MKSDEELKRDVDQELLWDPALDARNVTATVCNRIVTLEGSVESCAQKLAVQKAVQRVSGARAVVLDVVIRAPSPLRHSDEDLAAAIVSALQWQEGLPANAIRVMVERGCVTITGRSSTDFSVKWLRRLSPGCVAWLAWPIRSRCELIRSLRISARRSPMHCGGVRSTNKRGFPSTCAMESSG